MNEALKAAAELEIGLLQRIVKDLILRNRYYRRWAERFALILLIENLYLLWRTYH